MKFGRIAASLAAVSLLAAPVAAQADTIERASAPATGESELGGTLLLILVAIAAAIGAFLIFDDNDDPVSP